MSKSDFEKLYEFNVNHKTDTKNGLKYLSWAYAWAEFKKVYPSATYNVEHYDGKPYLVDAVLGYMVSTTVTVDDLTIPMHLPVLDGANKSMKAEAYTYSTKYKDKECAAASMFDINTAIMRCLTKNLAMFGLGLYIYAGEDIPSVDGFALDDIAHTWINAAKNDIAVLEQITDANYKQFIKDNL